MCVCYPVMGNVLNEVCEAECRHIPYLSSVLGILDAIYTSIQQTKSFQARAQTPMHVGDNDILYQVPGTCVCFPFEIIA